MHFLLGSPVKCNFSSANDSICAPTVVLPSKFYNISDFTFDIIFDIDFIK